MPAKDLSKPKDRESELWGMGALGGIFLLIAAAHLFSNRHLWEDEWYVYRNIGWHSYGRLFKVLDPVQSFPRIYLALIKYTAGLFHFSAVALRFPSFLCMIGAAGLWIGIYRRELPSLSARLTAGLLFVASYRLTYYAAELKPYSMDVLAAALYALYFLRWKNPGAPAPRQELLWVVALPFLMFFSYAALIFAWIVPAHLLWKKFIRQQDASLFFYAAVSFLAVSVCFYWIDLRFSITTPGLDYWHSYFVRVDSLGGFLSSFGEGAKRLATAWWGTTKALPRAASPFVALAYYTLFRRGWNAFKANGFTVNRVESLGLLVFAALFVLGIFHKYPFTGERLTLFFAPFVCYYLAWALEDLRQCRTMYCIMSAYTWGICLWALMDEIGWYGRLYF
ncbi:MAG: hypothetical protein HQL23_00795 [Candidatus Omnitrophica bacterium]|nr:hypothetical protein [Candidatus Omnitrophota bacterium]